MLRIRTLLSTIDRHCSLRILKPHAVSKSHAARFVLSVATMLGFLAISANSEKIEGWWNKATQEDCTYGTSQWRCASFFKAVIERSETWDNASR